MLTCAAPRKEHPVQISGSFEPGFEASPNRAYLSPPLTGGWMEKKLASGNNLPVFKCSHCLARGMPLVFGNSLSIGRFKENFKNYKLQPRLKLSPRGSIRWEIWFRERASLNIWSKFENRTICWIIGSSRLHTLYHQLLSNRLWNLALLSLVSCFRVNLGQSCKAGGMNFWGLFMSAFLLGAHLSIWPSVVDGRVIPSWICEVGRGA